MLIDTSYFQNELTIGQINSPAVVAAMNPLIEKYEDSLLTNLLGYAFYKEFKAGLLVDPIDQKWIDLLYGKEYTNSADRLTRWRGLLENSDTLDLGTYYPDDIEIPVTGDLIGATTYVNSFLEGKTFRVVQRGYGPLGSKATINEDGFTLNAPHLMEEDDVYFIQFIAPVPIQSPGVVVSGTSKKSLIANYVYFMYLKDNVSFTMGAGEVKVKPTSADNVNPYPKMVRAWNEMVDWNVELLAFLYEHKDVYTTYEETVNCHWFETELVGYKNRMGI